MIDRIFFLISGLELICSQLSYVDFESVPISWLFIFNLQRFIVLIAMTFFFLIPKLGIKYEGL